MDTTELMSIEDAKPRPKVVNYGDASLAIQDAACNVLTGGTSTQTALDGLQAKLTTLVT